MYKWLRKHFIPHADNDHQPHFLRTKNIRVLALIILVVELGVLSLSYVPSLNPVNNGYMATVLPAVLGELSNENRAENHLAVLTTSPLLNKVAELKAKDMAEKGYFAHTSPEGKAPWYWFNLAGYKYLYAGENLAVDFSDSKDVTTAWMNSPTHRANIIKNVYTEMGTAVASGTFEGHKTVFVVQVYAEPLPKTAVDIQPLNIKPTKILDKESTTTKVLGASVETAVEATPVDTTPAPVYPEPSLIDKFMSSPRHIANFILILLGMMVASAIIFKLFIRTDKKHPYLINNGLIILVILVGVYTANNLIAKNKMNVNTTFMSFGSEVLDTNL